MSFSRREFLTMATAAAIAPRWLHVQEPVHAAIIYADPFRDTLLGALVACDEAQRAASLLRRRFQHSIIHIENLNAAALRGVTHVVIACDRWPELMEDVVMIDAVKAADSRGVTCGGNLWHIPPLLRHQRMIENKAGGAITAWHAELERFGAGQLNARYRAAGIEHPGGQTWCGWMAVKCIWESALRNVAMPELSFDGHKGRRLFFGAQSRNLIQPIYVVRDDKVVQEWNPPETIEDVPCGSP
jgi:hypothetical protein